MINESSWGLSGDVNYHLGTAVTRKINNKNIRLSILPNPSHL
jgi:2-oxoglutarate dehydrogenase complex dehydrogenase (E1) component-like enzyme